MTSSHVHGFEEAAELFDDSVNVGGQAIDQGEQFSRYHEGGALRLCRDTEMLGRTRWDQVPGNQNPPCPPLRKGGRAADVDDHPGGLSGRSGLSGPIAPEAIPAAPKAAAKTSALTHTMGPRLRGDDSPTAAPLGKRGKYEKYCFPTQSRKPGARKV